MKKIMISMMSVSLFLNLGCSVLNSLESVKNDTSAVKVGAEDIKRKTEEVSNKTTELYDDLRHNEAEQKRRQLLHDMNQTTNSALKISLAAKYYMSFEYQLWGGKGYDTAKRRQEMAALALKEFLIEIQQFIPDRTIDISPLSPKDPSMNLNVLTATMDIDDPKQDRMREAMPELKHINILSLLKDGLKIGAGLRNKSIVTTQFAPEVEEVLNFEKLSIDLIKNRVQFLPVLVLTQVSDLGFSNLTAAKMYFMNWELDLEQLNIVQMKLYTKYLHAAVEDIEFLKSIGVEVKLNSSVVDFYKNMKIKNEKNQSFDGENKQVQQEFVKSLKSVQKL